MDIISDGPTLVLQGAFDVRSTWEVRAAIYERLDGTEDDLVIDMADVTTIDATALRLLAVATRHAWLTGHHLTHPQPRPGRTPDDAPDPAGPRHRGRAGRGHRLTCPRAEASVTRRER